MKNKFIFMIVLGILLVLFFNFVSAVIPCREEKISVHSGHPECEGWQTLSEVNSFCNSECKSAGYGYEGGESPVSSDFKCECLCYSYSGCYVCGIGLNADEGEYCGAHDPFDCERFYQYGTGGYGPATYTMSCMEHDGLCALASPFVGGTDDCILNPEITKWMTCSASERGTPPDIPPSTYEDNMGYDSSAGRWTGTRERYVNSYHGYSSYNPNDPENGCIMRYDSSWNCDVTSCANCNYQSKRECAFPTSNEEYNGGCENVANLFDQDYFSNGGTMCDAFASESLGYAQAVNSLEYGCGAGAVVNINPLATAYSCEGSNKRVVTSTYSASCSNGGTSMLRDFVDIRKYLCADGETCSNGVCSPGVSECNLPSDCGSIAPLSNNCNKWDCVGGNCVEVPNNGISCDPCDFRPGFERPVWCGYVPLPGNPSDKDRHLACGDRICSNGACIVDTSDLVAAGYPWGVCSGNLSTMCKERQCDGAGFCGEGNIPQFGKHPLCIGENECKVNACNGNGGCIPYRTGVYPDTEWPANYKTIVFPADSSATCSTWNSNGWWGSVQTLGLNDNAFSSGCCGFPLCPGGSVKVGTATYTYSCRSIADGCTGYNGYSGFYPTPYAALRCSSGTMCCYEITTGGGGDGGDNGFCPPFCDGGGGGCGSGLTKCLDGSCKANCNEPIDAHTACLEGSCIAVPGEGPTGCTLDSECNANPLNPSGFHTECSSGNCVSVNGSGNNQCSNDEQCFNPGINPVNPLLVHTECVNYECKIVSGAGENICSDDFRCPLPQWFLNISSDGTCRMFAGKGESTCAITPGTITAIYWENINGAKINKTDLRDNVYVVIEGASLGQIINYRILMIDGCLFGTTDCDAIWPLPGGITSNGSGKDKILWKAGNMTTKFSEGIFYIGARINGGSWGYTEKGGEFEGPHGELNVSEENNSAPHASIVSPINKQIYFAGEKFNITSNVGDEDSKFNCTLDLGDGTTETVNCSGLGSFDVVYNNTIKIIGQKNIKLTVVDEGGKTATDRIAIMIINASYPFNTSYLLAYIDEPRWGSDFFSKIVKFNASSTYAVNVTHNSSGVEKIICIAGNCPNKTMGCPGEYPVYPACQIPVSGTPKWAEFENINFSWMFNDGSKKSGKGMKGAVFNKTFRVPGNHQGILNASLNPNSLISTEFLNNYGPYCERESNPVGILELVNGNLVFTSYTSPNYNCSKDNSTSCCPGDLSFCNNKGKCEKGAVKCENLTQEECVEGNLYSNLAFLALNDLLKEDGYSCRYSNSVDDCEESVDCLCKWDGTECKPSAEYTLCANKGDCYFDIGTIGDCSQTSSVLLSWTTKWGGVCTECSTTGTCEMITDQTDCRSATGCTWDRGCHSDLALDCSIWNTDETTCATYQGYGACAWSPSTCTDAESSTKPAYCEDGQKSAPCPAQLSFVNLTSIILAILLISMIYLRVRWTRKK